MYFHYFVIISSWKLKDGAFQLNKLEFPSPKNALFQVWMNWLSGSGEEEENRESLPQRRQQRQRRTTDKSLH